MLRVNNTIAPGSLAAVRVTVGKGDKDDPYKVIYMAPEQARKFATALKTAANNVEKSQALNKFQWSDTDA